MLQSRGFNEPKRVNAHGLSNFREFEKNLRETPVWRFFVVSPYGPKKSEIYTTRMLFQILLRA